MLFAALLGVVLLAIYSFQVIKRYTGTEPIHFQATSVRSDQFNLNFEDDSMVTVDDLQAFFPFLNESIDFQTWLKRKRELQEVKLIKKAGQRAILFLRPWSAQLYWKNDCARNFCLQRKLSFNRLPMTMVKSIIGVEDYRFLSHKGVDLKAIARAIWIDLKEMKLKEGGSTITQQLIRNIYLTNEKSFIRKLNEVILSLYFESFYSKENILEAYLNEIQLGSLSGVRVKGVGAASLVYFEKPIERLDAFEISILVSLVNGPYYFHPLRNPDRLRTKATNIYQKLKRNKMVSQLDDSLWSDKKYQAWLAGLKLKQTQPNLRVIAYLQRDMFRPRSYAHYALLSRGHRLLKQLQQTKEQEHKPDLAFKVFIHQWRCNQPQCETSFEYYSKIEKDTIRAMEQEKHQVGSLLKPILYRHFLNQGLEWDYMVESGPFTLQLKSGPWEPKETSVATDGYLNMKQSYQQSKNIPLVRIAAALGFEELENYLSPILPGMQVPLGEYPAQILGSIELSMSELANTYQAFLGRECENLLADELNVIEPLLDHSKTTIRYRLPRNLQDLQFFGKTGTSNRSVDNWFMGFSGREFILIWFGLETGKKNHELKLAGSSTAFPLFMHQLLFSGSSLKDFDCESYRNNRLQNEG